MGELLDALSLLQRVEMQLAAFRRGDDEKRKRVETHQRQVAEIDEKIAANKMATRERQVRVDNLSLEVSSRDQSIEKHRTALQKTKTNKEYAAILASINTEKADNTKIEKDVLEMMEQVQTLETEGKRLEAERRERTSRLASAELAFHEHQDRHKPDRARLLEERQKISKNISPEVVASFLRVADRHEGEAMAAVQQIHPKREEFACTGCNITVTLDVVNNLRVRDDLQFCKVCGRILFVPANPATPLRTSR